MLSNKEDGPPGDYKTWKEYNNARKEKRRLKMEYKLEKLDKQKEKAKAAAKPEETKKPTCCSLSTLSIAVPGSILDNAQSIELRTYLAGQIARAACVFKVDEIVVYDDMGVQDSVTTRTVSSVSEDGEVSQTRRCCAQLARILQYLECPQYLRREFFPKHRDLEYAGLLNPLDAPHHVRQQDETRFREGIVINQPAKTGCYVNVGLLKSVKVDRPLQAGLRVTVEMLPAPSPDAKRSFGKVVPPSYPRQATGIYWGYSVRLAKSLNAIFSQSPYKEGYDLTVGTSERGDPVESVSFGTHKHAIVVFGGLAGLEAALEADEVLTVENPAFLFDFYVNTCPDQGSRTIRTEEAILITLAELRRSLKPEVVYEKPSNDSESEGGEEDEEVGQKEEKINGDSCKQSGADSDKAHDTSSVVNLIKLVTNTESFAKGSVDDKDIPEDVPAQENIKPAVRKPKKRKNSNKNLFEESKLTPMDQTPENKITADQSIEESSKISGKRKKRRKSHHNSVDFDE